MHFAGGRFHRHDVDAEVVLVFEEGVGLPGEHKVGHHPAISLRDEIVHPIVLGIVIGVGIPANHTGQRPPARLERRQHPHQLFIEAEAVLAGVSNRPAPHRMRHIVGRDYHGHIVGGRIQHALQPVELGFVEDVVASPLRTGPLAVQEDYAEIFRGDVVVAVGLAGGQVEIPSRALLPRLLEVVGQELFGQIAPAAGVPVVVAGGVDPHSVVFVHLGTDVAQYFRA